MELFPEADLPDLLPEGPTPADLVLLAGETPERSQSRYWMAGAMRLEVEAAADTAGLYIANAFRVHATTVDGVRAIRAARPSLEHAIREARPKLVVVFGAVAARALWPDAKPTQGVLRALDLGVFHTQALPTVSPGAVLYEPALRHRFVEDLKTAAAYLKGEMRGWTPDRRNTLRLDLCDSHDTVMAMLAEAASVKEIGLDTETRGKRQFGPKPPDRFLVTVQIATSPTTAYCIPIAHPEQQYGCIDDSSLDAIAAFLRAFDGEIFVHNAKFDQRALWSVFGRIPRATFDPMLAHSILTGDFVGNGLKPLVWTYTDDLGGYEAEAEAAFRKVGWDASKVPLSVLAPYGCLDAIAALRVGSDLRERLRARRKVANLNRTTMAFSNIVSMAEVGGVQVDWEFLQSYGVGLMARIETLKGEIREICGAKFLLAARDVMQEYGKDFNFASQDHRRILLYRRLGLSTPVKTDGGKDATSKAALDTLEHPAVEKLKEITKAEQELKLYVRAWPRYRSEDDRIRPEYSLVRRDSSEEEDGGGARSGRAAARNPNVQQLPRKGDIRRAIIADSPDHVLASFDFANLEMRVVSMLSQDEKMLAFFASGGDFHRMAAAEIFHVEAAAVTKEQRDIAKTIAFAVLFGAGPPRVALMAKITMPEAERFVEEYYTRFPGLKSWRRRSLASAVRNGYVETIFGRRRSFPELKGARSRHSMSKGERKAFGHALRAAANHLVQSAGADICFNAAVRVHQALPTGPRRPRFTMTVHDELLFNVLREDVHTIVPLIRDTMSDSGLDFVKRLGVSIAVDAKLGNNFKELSPYAAGVM